MARKSRYQGPLEGSAAPGDQTFTACLYLRLSVEDGDDLEHNSIGNQKKIALDFLKDRRDIVLSEIYTDHGRTGMNGKRPGYQAMLAALEAGALNCVIVKDVSRLGRHYILTSELVERKFPELGVRLICINDGYDSADAHADQGSLLMPFKLIMNDSYVKDISRKIQSSIDGKICSGAYLPSSGSVPYGYLRVPEGNTYAADPEAAAVVKRIFELRAGGAMFNTIAKTLNQEGVLSPGRLRYERGLTRAETYRDALWLRGTIRKMTNDPVYMGVRVHGREKRERLGGGKKRRPPEEWQCIENAHPAIVSRALFQRVQEVNKAQLTQREALVKQDRPAVDHREIFAGKVFCGDCGARMTAGKRVQRAASSLSDSYFFNCAEYRDSNHQRCANHYIRQEALMTALRHLLDRQVETAADVERLMAEARTGGQRSDAPGALLLSLRNRRFHLEARLARLLEDVAAGLLDREEYLSLKMGYLEECAQVEAQERQAREALESNKKALEATKTWLSEMGKYKKAPVIDRALVDALVEKILVYDNKSIRVCLTYCDPYGPLEACLEGGQGGRGRVG